ncbi:MAG: DUF1992 domain-containing protein [Pseudomonadota bacterium]
MAADWQRLTEQQIRKAQLEGKLSGLDGEGKPLPHRPEEAYLDAGEAAAHRIMAEAGALPEEVRLKKELAAAQEAYRAAKGTDAEKPAMRRVADVQMKLSIAQEARRKFMKG